MYALDKAIVCNLFPWDGSDPWYWRVGVFCLCWHIPYPSIPSTRLQVDESLIVLLLLLIASGIGSGGIRGEETNGLPSEGESGKSGNMFLLPFLPFS